MQPKKLDRGEQQDRLRMPAKEAQLKITVIEAILADYRERLALTASDTVKAFPRTEISEGEAQLIQLKRRDWD